MPFLIIPNEAYANSATIWVGAINEHLDPAVTTLEYGSTMIPLNSGWSDLATADGTNRIRYQRVRLDNLTQATAYNLALRVGGQVRADGSFTTIPWRLPNQAERPFIVLLGSCFYRAGDPEGRVGQTYKHMPEGARPNIKFLSGDQVYLDNPPRDFINPLKGRNWLESRSFKSYVDSWTQLTQAGGFTRLLKQNANFFSSDDHEYWNNAPDVGLNVPVFATTSGGREEWWGIARTLYTTFQTSPGLPVTFKIDPLSFCIAETRFFRGKKRETGEFAPQAHIDEIGRWTASLDGPGVLVLGQPFFAIAGDFKDYALQNYEGQFEQLRGHLRRSRHSIVILSGDVHFGRVAVADLRPELGTKLYEVISSPMQLVPHAEGKYAPAPQVFGMITSEADFSQARNHFLTLEFAAPSSRRASMLVRYWPIIENGSTVQSQVVGSGAFELDLKETDMLSIRQSTAEEPNKSLVDTKPKSRARSRARSGAKADAGRRTARGSSAVGATDGVILLGGASISHFRIRVAQSHARADLHPSRWSIAGVLLDAKSFLSVPLELCAEASEIALGNGVQTCNMADYDDPARFPNIAVIRFTKDTDKILTNAKLIAGDREQNKPAQRGIIDLPAMMLPWLSFIWIAGKAGNPLAEGLGLPSAAFVETVYGMAGIELTPGLASSTSCPEAIWQSAKILARFLRSGGSFC